MSTFKPGDHVQVISIKEIEEFWKQQEAAAQSYLHPDVKLHDRGVIALTAPKVGDLVQVRFVRINKLVWMSSKALSYYDCVELYIREDGYTLANIYDEQGKVSGSISGPRASATLGRLADRMHWRSHQTIDTAPDSMAFPITEVSLYSPAEEAEMRSHRRAIQNCVSRG
jgi:hypothetical protein